MATIVGLAGCSSFDDRAVRSATVAASQHSQPSGYHNTLRAMHDKLVDELGHLPITIKMDNETINIVVPGSIAFDKGLSKRLKAVLKKTGRTVSKTPGTKVRILEHGEFKGASPAKASAQLMIQQGLKDHLVDYYAKGLSEPLNENTTERGKRRNQRIELVIFPYTKQFD